MRNRDTDDADYYRRESEEAQEKLASLRREQASERRSRLAEMREQGERYMRTAEDWQDAFSKQRSLYRREIGRSEKEYEDDLIRYFQQGIEVVDLGEQLYNTEMAAIAPQVQELLAQIKALKHEAMERVAAQIEREFSDNQDAIAHSNALAEALRANEPSEWLNW